MHMALAMYACAQRYILDDMSVRSPRNYVFSLSQTYFLSQTIQQMFYITLKTATVCAPQYWKGAATPQDRVNGARLCDKGCVDRLTVKLPMRCSFFPGTYIRSPRKLWIFVVYLSPLNHSIKVKINVDSSTGDKAMLYTPKACVPQSYCVSCMDFGGTFRW